METKLSCVFPFLPFLLFLFMVLRHRKQRKLAPGPWKMPLIGNLHQLVGALPHHSLANLARKHGPIIHLQLGEASTLVFSSPEAAAEVFRIHDINFADRIQTLATKILSYDFQDIGVAPYGDRWRQLRRICILELLSMKRVRSFEWIRVEEVSNFVESISESGVDDRPVNLSEKLFSLSRKLISRAAFGGKLKDAEELMLLVKKSNELTGGFKIHDFFPSIRFLERINGMKTRIENLHQMIDKILDHVIQEHRIKTKTMSNTEDGQVEEDLIDVLLRLQESGDHEFLLTDAIKGVTLDMFIGGTETSGTVVEWAMSEMMRNPRVMELAQAEVRGYLKEKDKNHIEEKDMKELNYLKLVIKETLRLHPPLPLLVPREAREECQVSGYQVPKKTKIIVSAWAIGRDPKVWVNSECFEPERFDGSPIDFKGTDLEFIPFGAGRRMCPGASFGIANVELPLANLLYHFKWELPNGIKPDTLDMTEAFGSIVRRKHDLYLIAKTYTPPP